MQCPAQTHATGPRSPGVNGYLIAGLCVVLLLSVRVQGHQPVHFFTYADILHPNLCTLAASVEAIGGRVNVLGLEDGDGAGAMPPSAVRGMLTTLAEASSAPKLLHWRSAAAVQCNSVQECYVRKNLFKVRKLFSLWPHLKDFQESDVLVFLDGFDTVLEAPSLEHLRASFERLQVRLAGFLGSQPGGVVLFNGEENCWPFPHTGPVSGDYRPDYHYNIGNRTGLRGIEVCDFWRRAASVKGHYGDGGKVGPIHLPFPNSGAFMGTVQSLRRMYEWLAQLLHSFGDFDDQALIYVAAMAAASAEKPWTPVWVDAHAEVLASLHGIDLEQLALGMQAPQVCNFPGRLHFGYFAAALESGPKNGGRWSTGQDSPPPPSILHFNGDKKNYFDTHCARSALEQAFQAGVPLERCRVISYSFGMEHSFADDVGRIQLDQRRVRVPMSAVTLTLNKMLAASSLSLSVGELTRALFAQGAGVKLVASVHTLPESGPCSVSCPWYHASPAAGSIALGWHSEVGAALSLDALVLKKNESGCKRHSRERYCRLFEALQHSWACLKDGVDGSLGLFWGEYEDMGRLQEMRSLTDRSRYARMCGSNQMPVEGMEVCPGQAAMDFLASLQHWEVSLFWVQHLRDAGVVLAVKLPSF